MWIFTKVRFYLYSGGLGADDAWCWHGATLSSVGGHSVTATIPTSRYNNSLDISTYLQSDGEYLKSRDIVFILVFSGSLLGNLIIYSIWMWCSSILDKYIFSVPQFLILIFSKCCECGGWMWKLCGAVIPLILFIWISTLFISLCC